MWLLWLLCGDVEFAEFPRLKMFFDSSRFSSDTHSMPLHISWIRNLDAEGLHNQKYAGTSDNATILGNGLQPNSDGLQRRAMASNLRGDGLQPLRKSWISGAVNS